MQKSLLNISSIYFSIALLSFSLPTSAETQTARLIVKYKKTALQAGNKKPLEQLNLATLRTFHDVRPMSYGAQVIALSEPVSEQEASRIAKTIENTGLVEYALPDKRKFPMMQPNDPEFNVFYGPPPDNSLSTVKVHHLWYLDQPNLVSTGTDGIYSVNAMQAWNFNQGSSLGGRAAILDSGILPHDDFDSARKLAGFDMISDIETAGDGDGRDNDPTDTGDGITSSSSWHGTFVSGIISATANNAKGIAGVNWKNTFFAVRVLGKGGGFDSDIVDGIRWAAGLSIPGVANNPNPAQVLNISLGSQDSCSPLYQQAFDEMNKKGVVSVIAAGNSHGNSELNTPANCTGVLAVSAHSRAGYLTDYTDAGSNVAISAPGGGTFYMITSPSNSGGLIANGRTDFYKQGRGTSFATPLVTGAVSLIQGLNPALSSQDVMTLLKAANNPFPKDSNCFPGRCGTGALDVEKAVRLGALSLIPNTSFMQFPETLIKSQTNSEVLTLRSQSSADITLGSASIVGVDALAFQVENNTCSGKNIKNGETCQLTVRFLPQTAGLNLADLQIVTNQSAGNFSLSLRGFANTLNRLRPNVSEVFFQSSLFSSSATQDIMYTNTGNKTFTISSVVLNDYDANEFAIMSNTCSGKKIEPSQSCSIGVRFQPLGFQSAYLATLEILSDAEISKEVVQLYGNRGSPSTSSSSSSSSGGSSSSSSSSTSSSSTSSSSGGNAGGGGCSSQQQGSGDASLALLLLFASLGLSRKLFKWR